MFTYIDYTADVQSAVKSTLDSSDQDYYLRLLKKPHDLTVLTEAQVKIHAQMGRVYRERGLDPITTYLGSK